MSKRRLFSSFLPSETNGAECSCQIPCKRNYVKVKVRVIWCFSLPETDLAACFCPVPCKRVRYEPNLSYAQLSRINVERLVLRDEQSRKRLQVGYSTYRFKGLILRGAEHNKAPSGYSYKFIGDTCSQS